MRIGIIVSIDRTHSQVSQSLTKMFSFFTTSQMLSSQLTEENKVNIVDHMNRDSVDPKVKFFDLYLDKEIDSYLRQDDREDLIYVDTLSNIKQVIVVDGNV